MNENVYLIEKSGTQRQIWGPYSEDRARREAGIRHFLARGTSRYLRNGNTVGDGEIKYAVQAGSIVPVDGRDAAS